MRPGKLVVVSGPCENTVRLYIDDLRYKIQDRDMDAMIVYGKALYSPVSIMKIEKATADCFEVAIPRLVKNIEYMIASYTKIAAKMSGIIYEKIKRGETVLCDSSIVKPLVDAIMYLYELEERKTNNSEELHKINKFLEKEPAKHKHYMAKEVIETIKEQTLHIEYKAKQNESGRITATILYKLAEEKINETKQLYEFRKIATKIIDAKHDNPENKKIVEQLTTTWQKMVDATHKFFPMTYTNILIQPYECDRSIEEIINGTAEKKRDLLDFEQELQLKRILYDEAINLLKGKKIIKKINKHSLTPL